MGSSPSQHELFPAAAPSPARRSRSSEPAAGRVVRVVCDVASIHREFEYLIPDRLLSRSGIVLPDGNPPIGTMVRVPLHGRQVAAWVVAVDVEPTPGVELRAVTKVSGHGPPDDILELCRWAAWRWSGRLPTLLGAASPPSMVTALPRPSPVAGVAVAGRVGARVAALFESPVSAIRLPPAASPMEVVRAAAARGHVLVVAPTFASVRSTADAMRRSGITAVVHPDGWARGAAGCSVVGTRTAAFAPVDGLASIVVLDEHDESLQHEGSPTWNARDVAVERGRRAGVPVVLVSSTPSLEALAHTGGALTTIDRVREREGWARLEVVDRREDDFVRSGLYSEALVRHLQSDRRVVCVLNRTGRAQMLGCLKCGTLAACERCDAAVRQDESGALVCPRCATERPSICAVCSGLRFRPIKLGVTKAREQLETLIREPVAEITGARPASGAGRTTRVMIGTEAALQRVASADVVAFLEFDQELGAPRYRAAEQALTLLARSARLVGGRAGTVLVQTRQPDHEVLRAALTGDPSIVSAGERERRELLQFPPTWTIVMVGGDAAPLFVESVRGRVAGLAGGVVDAAGDGRWLIRSSDRAGLADVLWETPRPAGRLRLQVDPARLPT